MAVASYAQWKATKNPADSSQAAYNRYVANMAKLGQTPTGDTGGPTRVPLPSVKNSNTNIANPNGTQVTITNRDHAIRQGYSVDPYDSSSINAFFLNNTNVIGGHFGGTWSNNPYYKKTTAPAPSAPASSAPAPAHGGGGGGGGPVQLSPFPYEPPTWESPSIQNTIKAKKKELADRKGRDYSNKTGPTGLDPAAIFLGKIQSGSDPFRTTFNLDGTIAEDLGNDSSFILRRTLLGAA